MSQRDLAQAVGISTGSVHYVLKAFVDKGLVKLGNFTSSEDKRRYAYMLTPKGISEKAALTNEFLIRKMAEFRALESEIKEVRDDLSQSGLTVRDDSGNGCKTF